MTFDEYQAQALTTDVAQLTDKQIEATNPAHMDKVLGLVGEAGEVAEKYKKIIRDNREGIISETDRVELLKELGDVLWYIAVLSEYLGSDLSHVAESNLAKLADRNERGTIQSKGDNR